jgi:PTS system galactitol-specific IIA component
MDRSNLALFDEKRIFLDLEFSSQQAFFEFISEKLYQQGMVKESFLEGISEREKKYPTGLPSSPFPVAIPHCDPIHVIQNSISIVRFKKPIMFEEMGNPGSVLAVDFAFVLTLDGKLQSPILKELMKIFMSEEVMKKLKTADVMSVLGTISNS